MIRAPARVLYANDTCPGARITCKWYVRRCAYYMQIIHAPARVLYANDTCSGARIICKQYAPRRRYYVWWMYSSNIPVPGLYCLPEDFLRCQSLFWGIYIFLLLLFFSFSFSFLCSSSSSYEESPLSDSDSDSSLSLRFPTAAPFFVAVLVGFLGASLVGLGAAGVLVPEAYNKLAHTSTHTTAHTIDTHNKVHTRVVIVPLCGVLVSCFLEEGIFDEDHFFPLIAACWQKNFRAQFWIGRKRGVAGNHLF